MHLIRLLTCLLILSVVPVTASAFQLPEASVENMSKAVHDHMAGAMISGNHIITEDEAKSLQYPLLSYDLREKIMLRGSVSGLAKLCDLDWKERSFVPFMAGLRAQKTFNDYQLAYAGMLHGASMRNMLDAKAGMKCDDNFKANLEKSLSK